MTRSADTRSAVSRTPETRNPEARNPETLTNDLRAEAFRAGFDLCGVCPAVEPAGFSRFTAWLEAGYAGEMHYLADRADAYRHPRHVLDGVRSLVVLAQNYRTVDPAPAEPGQGRVSRYAWGDDYHDTIRARLNRLADWLRAAAPGCRARGVVDTAPLAEREFAVFAGLGCIGKNTLVLNTHWGSWFFLAVLLTDEPLVYDEPFSADHCGTCRACLDACPTDAFVEPYVLDARRCISYLTIEQRTALEPELRDGLGEHLFGCDICQDVCPWNRNTPATDHAEFQPRAEQNLVDLAELLRLDDAAFRQRFRGTPLWRAKRRGLLRNAALVLGGRQSTAAVPALIGALDDAEPLVRGAAAWALGRIANEQAHLALTARLAMETDQDVRREIASALADVAD